MTGSTQRSRSMEPKVWLCRQRQPLGYGKQKVSVLSFWVIADTREQAQERAAKYRSHSKGVLTVEEQPDTLETHEYCFQRGWLYDEATEQERTARDEATEQERTARTLRRKQEGW